MTPPLDAYWMPFTSNRDFKADPRLLVSASGMYYRDAKGREILDGAAGLWCVNAGHGHPAIVEAIQKSAATLDYAPPFQMGHPGAFELAETLVEFSSGRFSNVFFTNSGSEAVDTALKIALAYHRVRGEGTRTRLIGRERGYHGVGFGGISVGGMVNNRKHFGPMLAGVDHLPHTHSLEHNAFSEAVPQWGAHLADELERLVALHDASTIAGVIVEPVAGSTGVLISPEGYLQRLRDICDRHGILLIFDEVITGFGRIGTPFAADFFGVQPDLMTGAKGLTNGSVPMGMVMTRPGIYDTFMDQKQAGIELFHGYTYSAHPLACAAGNAALAVYRKERLVERANELSAYWSHALHRLKSSPNVIDIRTVGLIGGIELAPRAGAPGARGMEAFKSAFAKQLLVRVTGDIIALSPPLIIEKSQIDTIVSVLSDVFNALT